MLKLGLLIVGTSGSHPSPLIPSISVSSEPSQGTNIFSWKVIRLTSTEADDNDDFHYHGVQGPLIHVILQPRDLRSTVVHYPRIDSEVPMSERWLCLVSDCLLTVHCNILACPVVEGYRSKASCLSFPGRTTHISPYHGSVKALLGLFMGVVTSSLSLRA